MSDDPNVKQFEGSVPVNGEMTPISRVPIQSVDSSDWDDMGRTELFNQRQALENRLMIAMQHGQPTMIAALQNGIAVIDVRLNELYSDNFGLR